MLMNDNTYEEHLLAHFETPYHKGTLATANHTRREESRLSGDWVELQLLIPVTSADLLPRVEQAWFTGRGSLVSQAAASILCQHIEQRPITELREFQATDLLDLLRVPLTPNRQQCALLCFRALKAIVYALE